MGKKEQTGWSTQEGSISNSVGLSDFNSSHESSSFNNLQQTFEGDLTHSYHSPSRPASQESDDLTPVPLSVAGRNPRRYFNSTPSVPLLPDINLAVSSEEEARQAEAQPSQDSTPFYSALESTPASSKRGTPNSDDDLGLTWNRGSNKGKRVTREEWDSLDIGAKLKTKKKPTIQPLPKVDPEFVEQFRDRVRNTDRNLSAERGRREAQDGKEQPFAPGLVAALKVIGGDTNWASKEDRHRSEAKQSKENDDKKKCCIVM